MNLLSVVFLVRKGPLGFTRGKNRRRASCFDTSRQFSRCTNFPARFGGSGVAGHLDVLSLFLTDPREAQKIRNKLAR